jgi:three-Cys-motif partner protein
MNRQSKLKFDKIGYWSEIKLDIVKEYSVAYSTILSAQTAPRFYHVYIDAFAGAGVHISKTKMDFVPGSPLNALNVTPPFREFHLIDLDRKKIASLKEIVKSRADVRVYEGDCNDILLREVFPNVLFKDYRRGLCLLDPYGLHLNWEVIQAAGQMKTIDMFLNFPVADINRNVLWRNPEAVHQSDIERMNAFWGDDSWRRIAYTSELDLFGFEEKLDNETVANAFRVRLQKVAGFSHVARPTPMRNSRGATIYYLFFASQKPVAKDIIEQIFDKWFKILSNKSSTSRKK